MRLKKTAVALATVALLGVAACGGGDNGDSGPEGIEGADKAGGAGATLVEDAEAPAPEVEGAQEGGTATVIADVAPATFDPTRTYYVDSGEIMESLVARSLTQYRYNADTGQMELVPDMAVRAGAAERRLHGVDVRVARWSEVRGRLGGEGRGRRVRDHAFVRDR